MVSYDVDIVFPLVAQHNKDNLDNHGWSDALVATESGCVCLHKRGDLQSASHKTTKNKNITYNDFLCAFFITQFY